MTRGQAFHSGSKEGKRVSCGFREQSLPLGASVSLQTAWETNISTRNRVNTAQAQSASGSPSPRSRGAV